MKGIEYTDQYKSQLFNFHGLLLVLYIPFAFGFFWPLLVALHASYVPDLLRVRPRRCRLAAVLIIISSACSAPFIVAEVRSYRASENARLVEEQRRANALAQEQSNRIHASRQILAGGILVFSEPLTPEQAWALRDYFVFHALPDSDCLRAVQRYPSSLAVLTSLAGNKSCSPEALQTLYEAALLLQSTETPQTYPNADSLLTAIASNPRSCPTLLSKLLNSGLYGVRLAAAANPGVPKPQKIAYLRSSLASGNYKEREFAAADSDTPPEVLEQLASTPDFLGYLSNNPSTPDSVLQHILDTTDNSRIRENAMQNLARRHPPP